MAGTFAPFWRASDRPIAMACLRLFTDARRPRPDFSVPLFARRMALRTLFCADVPYFRPFEFELRRLAMCPSLTVGAAPELPHVSALKLGMPDTLTNPAVVNPA